MKQLEHESTGLAVTNIPLDAISFVSEGLVRPECVLCNVYGDIFTADWRGGIAHLLHDGGQKLYIGKLPDGNNLKTNGFSLNRDGSFLVAHLGETTGGIFRLTRNGNVSVFLDRVDGIDLPPCNFVFTDSRDRTWITISTRKIPRSDAYRKDVADGFVIMVDKKGARIVADGLYYTNEAAIDPSGKWLYVNETFGRVLSRFEIHENGELGQREIMSTFGAGTFPDGIAFDIEGYAWVTSFCSNRVIRVSPDGSQTRIVEDADPDHVKWVEEAYQRNELGRPHLDNVKSKYLKNISSLAFGGKNLDMGYLGCFLGDRIASMKMPVRGIPLTHWNYR